MNFVVQCWDSLEDQRGFHKDKLDRHERLGEALAHAGVAITITSITDIIAFGVGGTTVSQNIQNLTIFVEGPALFVLYSGSNQHFWIFF